MPSYIEFLMIGIIPILSMLTCLALSQSRFLSLNLPQGRYTTIDGLRGYLAIFVFIHHAQIWYTYLRVGIWKEPELNVFIHLGQSSVSLFFMITAFLFYSKIQASKSKPIDWTRIWVSRFTRLFPAYVFSILILLVLVMQLSHWQINTDAKEFLSSIIKWLTFTIRGYADINGHKNTQIIDAGVTWSLPYEWIFYFSLPVMAGCIGAKPPIAALLISIIVLLSVKFWHVDVKHSLAFFGGIFAVHAIHHQKIVEFAKTKTSSWLTISLLIGTASLSSSAYKIFPTVFLSIAFTLIVCGTDLFGILKMKGSRLLGEITFSIYLLHGIVLSSFSRWFCLMRLQASFRPFITG